MLLFIYVEIVVQAKLIYCLLIDGEPLGLGEIEKDLPAYSAKSLVDSKWTFITQEVCLVSLIFIIILLIYYFSKSLGMHSFWGKLHFASLSMGTMSLWGFEPPSSSL